jgi:hypothetical protein
MCQAIIGGDLTLPSIEYMILCEQSAKKQWYAGLAASRKEHTYGIVVFLLLMDRLTR